MIEDHSYRGSKRSSKYDLGDEREERKAERSHKKLLKYDLERIRRE